MNHTSDPGPTGTPPPDPSAPRKAPLGSAFFAWLRSLGIVRGNDRWFAGVAGGIAAKAGIDPLIVRGIFVVLALLGGPGILLYLLGWLLLPDFAGRLHLEDIVRGRAQAGVVTAAIVLAAVVIIPALVSVFVTGIVAVGPALWYTPWMPEWASTTLAWVLSIGLIVVLILWLRQLLRRRGESPHTTADATGPADGPAAGPSAAPGASGASAMSTEPTAPTAPTAPAASAGYSAAIPASPAASAANTHPASPTGGVPSTGSLAGEHGPHTAPTTGSPYASFTAPNAAAPPTGTGDPAPASHPAAHSAQPAQPASFSARTEHLAQRVGQQADDWGQRVGETATRWGAEVGAQAEAWGTRTAELYESRRLGAGQTVITLALALLAGGAAGVWAVNTGPALWIGTGASAPVIAGLIAALAVLAVSVIVAGVRGRQTGWIGFLSACAVLALLVTAVLPWGSRFQPFGEMHVPAGSTPGAVMVAGTTALDLSDARSGDGDLVVWQLAGRTNVILPERAPTVITLRMFAGQISEQGAEERETAGPLLSRTITANLPSGTSATTPDAMHVTVNLLFGQITVEGTPLGALERDGAGDPRDRTGGDSTDRSESERAAQLQEELDRLQWQLDRPGLHAREAAGLQRAHDAVSTKLQELELEDTP